MTPTQRVEARHEDLYHWYRGIPTKGFKLKAVSIEIEILQVRMEEHKKYCAICCLNSYFRKPTCAELKDYQFELKELQNALVKVPSDRYK